MNRFNLSKVDVTSEDLKTLDSWRGILSVFVFLGHLVQIFWLPILGKQHIVCRISGDIAHISVISFFCLSGFVIFRSLYLNITENNGVLNYKHYIISRISRIYPAFLASIILVLIIRYIVFHFDLLGGKDSYELTSDLAIARTHFDFSLEQVWLTIQMSGAYLANVNGPIWSLIIEWWLYFVGLLVFMLFSKYKIGIKTLILFLLYLCLEKITLLNSFIYLFIWALSGISFVFYFYKKIYQNITLVFGLVGLVGLIFYKIQNGMPIQISEQKSFQFLIAILFIGFFLRFKIRGRFFHFLSSFSYTLYIFHFPLLLFVFSITHSFVRQSEELTLLISILSILFCFTFSYLSSKFVESKNIVFNFLNKLF